MLDVANFPFHLKESIDPEVAQLSKAELDQLMRDIDAMSSIYGRDQAITQLQTPLGHHWRGDYKETLLNSLRGKVVVDLGCGRDEEFRRLLLEKDIAAYIGVDVFLDIDDGYYDSQVGKTKVFEQDGHPVTLVKGDVLDVVARLPDESCSFALNGIDDFIINYDSPYGRELIKQINRATEVGGFVCGVTLDYGLLTEFGQRMAYDPHVISVSNDLCHYERHKKLA